MYRHSIRFYSIVLLLLLISILTSCRNRDNKMIARGNIEFQKKNYEEALLYYKKALKINPNSWEAYYDMALCKANLGNDTGAINDYSNAAKINPRENVNIYINRGDLYYKIKDFEKAIADYKFAIELNPSNFDLYLALGSSYRNLKNYDDAIKNLKIALEHNSSMVKAYSELGYIYLVQKNYPLAIEFLDKGIAIDSTDAIMFNNRSKAKL